MRKTKILAAALAFAIALTGCAFAEGTWNATGRGPQWAGAPAKGAILWKDADGKDNPSANFYPGAGTGENATVTAGTDEIKAYTGGKAIAVSVDVKLDTLTLDGVSLDLYNKLEVATLNVSKNGALFDISQDVHVTVGTVTVTEDSTSKLFVKGSGTSGDITLTDAGVKFIPGTNVAEVTKLFNSKLLELVPDGDTTLHILKDAVVTLPAKAGGAISLNGVASTDAKAWGTISFDKGSILTDADGFVTITAAGETVSLDISSVVAGIREDKKQPGGLILDGNLVISDDVELEGKIFGARTADLTLVGDKAGGYFGIKAGDTYLKFAQDERPSGLKFHDGAYIETTDDGVIISDVAISGDVTAKGVVILPDLCGILADGGDEGAMIEVAATDTLLIKNEDETASLTIKKGVLSIDMGASVSPSDDTIELTSVDIRGLYAMTGNLKFTADEKTRSVDIGVEDFTIADGTLELGKKVELSGIPDTGTSVVIGEKGTLSLYELNTSTLKINVDGGTLALKDKVAISSVVTLGDGATLEMAVGTIPVFSGGLSKTITIKATSSDLDYASGSDLVVNSGANLKIDGGFNTGVQVNNGGTLTLLGASKPLVAKIAEGGTLAIAGEKAEIKTLECAEGAKVDVSALLPDPDEEGVELKTYETAEIAGEVLVAKALTVTGGIPETLPTEVEGEYYFYVAEATNETEADEEVPPEEGEVPPEGEGEGEGDGDADTPKDTRYKIAVALKVNADDPTALDVVAAGEAEAAPEDKPEPTPPGTGGEGEAPEPDILDDPECAPAIEDGTDANGAPVTVTPHATKDGVYIVNVTEATELPLATLPYTFKLPLIEGGKLVLGDGKDAKAVVDDKAEDDPFEYTVAGEKVSLNIGKLIKEKAAQFELFFRFPKATLEAAGTTPTAATGPVETEKLTVVVGEGVLKVTAKADPTTINYTDDADEETVVTATATLGVDPAEDATLMWTITDADGTVVTSDVLGSEPGANQNKELTIKASQFGLEKGAQAEFTFTVTATKGETNATSDPVKVKVVDSRTEGGSTPTQPGGSGSGGGGCAAGFAGLAFALVIPMFLKKR